MPNRYIYASLREQKIRNNLDTLDTSADYVLAFRPTCWLAGIAKRGELPAKQALEQTAGQEGGRIRGPHPRSETEG